MAGNFTFTTTGRRVLDNAYIRAQTTDSGFLDIGSETLTGDDFACEILTHCERDILQNHPALQRAVEDVTVPADSDEVPIPATMFGLSVIQIKLKDPGNVLDGLVLMQASNADGANRVAWSRENVRSRHPTFWYWNEERDAILLSFKVPEDTDFEVTFNLAPRTYTPIGLAGEISRIPNQHIETLYLSAGLQFALRMRKTETANQLMGEFAEANDKLMRSLIGSWWKRPAWRDDGHPGTTLESQVDLTPSKRWGPYSTGTRRIA